MGRWPSYVSGESCGRRTRYVWPVGEATLRTTRHSSDSKAATVAARQSARQRRMRRAPTGSEPSVAAQSSDEEGAAQVSVEEGSAAEEDAIAGGECSVVK